MSILVFPGLFPGIVRYGIQRLFKLSKFAIIPELCRIVQGDKLSEYGVQIFRIVQELSNFAVFR
jgi:hypothetical protein